jgi:amino acid adenylation domain-containing protein
VNSPRDEHSLRETVPGFGAEPQSGSCRPPEVCPGPWNYCETGLSETETKQFVAGISERCNISEPAVIVCAALLLAYRYSNTDDVSLPARVAAERHLSDHTVRLHVLPLLRLSEFFEDLQRQLGNAQAIQAHGEEASAAVLPWRVLFRDLQEDAGEHDDPRNKYPEQKAEDGFQHCLVVIECNGRPMQYRLRVHYRENVYQRWLAEQLAQHLAHIIRSWLSDRSAIIARLPLLKASEAEEILKYSQGSIRRYPFDRPLQDLFDDRVRSNPDGLALVTERSDGTIVRCTYRELQRRVCCLARRLRLSLSGQTGVSVAVYVKRSIESVVALLAILKAGAVYVALDVSYPSEYIQWILEDTRAALLIASAGTIKDAVPPHTSVIEIGTDEVEYPADCLFPEVSTVDPCLIMYTSGSTGRPKGVIHTQRQIINRLHWMWEAYPFEDGDVVGQRSPISVMPSMWELLGGLMAGVTTALIPDGTVKEPSELANFIHRHRISFVTVTPTILKLLLDVKEQVPNWPETLRVIVIGGEPLTGNLYQRFREAFPAATMVNDFGATEVNTILHMPLPPGLRQLTECQGYRPIANVSTFILDRYMRLVPFGAEGELCAAGASLALGYLNLPDATAERFVTAQLANTAPVTRLYRTGDMGYMAPNGAIYITGRHDLQIKINGMRVELEEVEHALALHPAVAECAVASHTGANGRSILTAYIVPTPGNSPQACDLQIHLKKYLLDHMVPRRFEVISRLPRRPNGKLDRMGLSSSVTVQKTETETPAFEGERTKLLATVRLVAGQVLGAGRDALDINTEFAALGFDSVAIIEFAQQLSKELGCSVPVPKLFEHPTLNRLAEHLEAESAQRRGQQAPGKQGTPRARSRGKENGDAIAIIGMSGRFPGADGIAQFWENLRSGVESIGTAAPGRWTPESIYDPDPSREGHTYSKWGGFLSGADMFDAAFFNILPSEARVMDPQHRLCLMESWRALEDAAYTGDRLNEQTVGVFIGARQPDYTSLLTQAGLPPNAESLLGNDMALLAARVSYFCDLRGPSMVVNTACSSSLVAVHLACRSLQNGDSTLALAGGVCITNDPSFYVATSKLNVFSSTGHCRAFDDSADGFVHGEAVGFVVLKPLERALQDRDHIYAVISGTAMNQDGRSNGITAPNGSAQFDLQERLYTKLKIDPATIGYVEAHGTGTRLGDPIEVDALTRSFRKFTERRQYCALGSVKTNIGHATAAAGIAGLIKTVLCLYHRQFVPSLHFDQSNALIDFTDTPFYVNRVSKPWPSPGDQPRRAAVNAFGIGGTNVHCVVEEPPAAEWMNDSRSPAYLVPVTARCAESLDLGLASLYIWLNHKARAYELRDFSYSLLAGRKLFSRGYVFVARDWEDLHLQLKQLIETGVAPPHARPLAFAGDAALNGKNRGPEQVSESATASTALDLPGPEELSACPPHLYVEKLLRIADLIAKGLRFDWRTLYRGQTPKFVPAPTYEFAKRRFWIEPLSQEQSAPPRHDSADDVHSETTLEAVMQAVGSLLDVESASISPEFSLWHHGIDSLRATALKQALERAFGFIIPLQILLEGQSIAEIARHLEGMQRDRNKGDTPRVRHDLLSLFLLGKLDLDHISDEQLDLLHRALASRTEMTNA